jgi:NAD(P)-dependent dehydrogenase (short-subunit alcohol dehydrogenase family)
MALIETSAPTAKEAVWFITGCSTGLGRNLAKHLLDEGCRTVVTARNPEELSGLVGSGESLQLKLDVTEPIQVNAAVKAAENRFGRIDVLVNNAGVGYFAAVEEGEDAQVRKMSEVNVFRLGKMIQAVLPGMRQRK